MHHEEFGLSFSGPLPLAQNAATNPVVLLLDPTPNRMATAQALVNAGLLPISANTSWAQCLELALATLLSSDTLPKAVIIEASHLLVSPLHTRFTTTLTPARQYYELPSYQPLTAQQLAGYLAVQGFSLVEISFILYISEPLALLSTSTIINSQSNQETTNPHDHSSDNLYFTASIERTPASDDKFHYYNSSSGRNPTSFENNPPVTTHPENNEDRLLAVLTYFTGIYLCRNCHQRIAPLELAHLGSSYQLWCERCGQELFTLKREETSLSPFQRRINQLYREHLSWIVTFPALAATSTHSHQIPSQPSHYSIPRDCSVKPLLLSLREPLPRTSTGNIYMTPITTPRMWPEKSSYAEKRKRQ